MKIYELLFGSLSIISFILAFKIEKELYKVSSIFVGILVLLVVYLSSNMKNIKEIADLHQMKLKN